MGTQEVNTRVTLRISRRGGWLLSLTAAIPSPGLLFISAKHGGYCLVVVHHTHFVGAFHSCVFPNTAAS